MKKFSSEEQKQKRLIYDSMSARGRKWVDKIGYDNWDPFMKPKEPPFMKGFDLKAELPENPLELYHFFMKETTGENPEINVSEHYKQAALDACQTIKQFEERVRAYHDVYVWYKSKKERIA